MLWVRVPPELLVHTPWRRPGVTFTQDRYIPAEFDHPIRLKDFVAYESSWPKTNRRREKLIDKEIDEELTEGEEHELAQLQAYAEYYLDKTTPLPLEMLESLRDSVLRDATRRNG